MIVHVGWLGSPPPHHVTAAVEAMRAKATGCEVRLHTALPERWAAASRLLPTMQSDVLRHAVLLKHGGLWLDADVRLISSPTAWASSWDRYTAVRLGGPASMIGTDIIYMPEGWGGRSIIEEYITAYLANLPPKVRLSDLASRMIQACMWKAPDAFQILAPGTRFPFKPAAFGPESVVARGFDPPPARVGLGDMVKAGLSAIGITEERLSKAIGRPCGCGKRAEKLNEFGRRIGIG